MGREASIIGGSHIAQFAALWRWCGFLNPDSYLLMKRLDALINAFLVTARPANKELTVIDKVRILSKPGLRPVEIARILGISVNQVNVNLSALRKKKIKKKPRKKNPKGR